MHLIRLPDLCATFEPDGRVLLRATTHGIAARVPPFAIGVVAFCSSPRTLKEIAETMGPAASQIAQGLREAGLLVSPKEASHTPTFFDNFASLDVHRRMLDDRVRIEAYRRALNDIVQPGMRVLDAGTGTGLLAVLAARAGAEKVYAVDAAEITDQAKVVIQQSGLANRIEVIRSDVATVTLPEQVDLIVTETFGALALVEGAAADLEACVQRCLAPGGQVMPHHIGLYVGLVTGPGTPAEITNAFEIDGVNLSSLRTLAMARATTLTIPTGDVAPGASQWARVRFPDACHQVRGNTELPIHGGTTVFGLAAWFTLELSDAEHLETGPQAAETHWHQTYLPFEPVCIPHDSTITVALELEAAFSDRRGLTIVATLGGALETTHRWRAR